MESVDSDQNFKLQRLGPSDKQFKKFQGSFVSLWDFLNPGENIKFVEDDILFLFEWNVKSNEYTHKHT